MRSGAQRLQDADLLGPLEHGPVHRVGDPEAGQEQRDHGQPEQRDPEAAEQVFEAAEEVAERLRLESE